MVAHHRRPLLQPSLRADATAAAAAATALVFVAVELEKIGWR